MANRAWPAGIIDTHVHTAPDVLPRLMDDYETAQDADRAQYGAIVLKSHHTLTAARATMQQRHVQDVKVLGGVVMNVHSTGGINPYAIDVALKLGAKIVWMPTITSSNQIRYGREVGIRSQNLKNLGTIEGDGLDVLDADGRPTADLCKVLDLIAEAGATLATGHISAAESLVVVPEARRRGVPNVIVTHPELLCISMTVEQQLELSEHDGVFFERVLSCTMPSSDGIPMSVLAESARTVGISSTIMASDFGQAHNAPPVEGLRSYISAMRDLGFSQDELEQMTVANPGRALSLG